MATAKTTTTTKNKAADAPAFSPKFVHAYRRVPHLVPGPGDTMIEKAVEVVFDGEKVSFKSNEAGHVVGLVSKESVFRRLTREIPEAYIEYRGGDNVPEPVKAAPVPQAPPGEFVLSNGSEFVVLDEMDDAEVRDFAAEAGIDGEQLPEVLEGDALKQAVVNLLKTD